MNNTKEQLAEALEALLEVKPLKKITVGEISAACGVSRMTFYYHFKDLYELVKWAFVWRVKENVTSVSSELPWEDGLRKVFQMMIDNKVLVMNVYESVGHGRLYSSACEVLKEYAYKDFELECSSRNISDEDRRFVSTFFVNAVIGTCFNWISNGMDESMIEPIVKKCQIALHASVGSTLDAFGR